MQRIDENKIQKALKVHSKEMKRICDLKIANIFKLIDFIEKSTDDTLEISSKNIVKPLKVFSKSFKKKCSKDSKVKNDTFRVEEIDDEFRNVIYEIKVLLNHISSNMESILTSKPDQLLKENDRVYAIPCDKKVREAIVKLIFNYDSFVNFSGYSAYSFCDNLGVTVCPYCNRNYVKTVKGKKVTVDKSGKKETKVVPVTRAQLDHYYPKNQYPLLRVSFYNLVPSCSICNHVKGKDDRRHLHPYIHNVDLSFNTDAISYDGTAFTIKEDYEVNLDCCNDVHVKNSVDVFHINTVYSEHKEIAEDMINVINKYSEKYDESLTDLLGVSDDEYEDLKKRLYGVVDDSMADKIPMSIYRKSLYDTIVGLKG